MPRICREFHDATFEPLFVLSKIFGLQNCGSFIMQVDLYFWTSINSYSNFVQISVNNFHICGKYVQNIVKTPYFCGKYAQNLVKIRSKFEEIQPLLFYSWRNPKQWRLFLPQIQSNGVCSCPKSKAMVSFVFCSWTKSEAMERERERERRTELQLEP